MSVLLVAIFACLPISGDFAKSETAFSLAKCCSEGKKAARIISGQTSCYKKPFVFSNPGKMCLSVYKICCLSKEKDQACAKGEIVSRTSTASDFSCARMSHRNTLHGSSFLECCKCCQLGRIGAKSNKTCSHDDLPFNGTCGGIYQRCCAIFRREIVRLGPRTCTDAKCAHECHQTIAGPVCSCRKGFRLLNGSRLCRDIDECEHGTHKCLSGWKCKNLLGTYRCLRRFVVRSCRKGYRFENGICRDVDECALASTKCPTGTVCENVLGGYLCTRKPVVKRCRKGYYLSGARCIDVNECRAGNPCKRGQRCVNTYGSYICSVLEINCSPGYYFSNASMACLDRNECVTGTHQCKGDGDVCRNTYGSYRCICARGYFKKKGICEDRDECKIYKGKLCSHKCTNLPGSYRCECNKGFHLSRNKRTCLDTNECTNKNICPNGASCFNMPGEYKCIQTKCLQNYVQRSARSCKLSCPAGVDCRSLPVSIKWFAVSRRGPVRRLAFRLIYDVDVKSIFNLRRVDFRYAAGNEENNFGLQKYGFSKVIIYNKKALTKTAYYHLKIVGTAILELGRRITFEYNLHSFIYAI